MSRRQYILEIVNAVVKDQVKAETIVDRLTDEGLLAAGYGDPNVDAVVDKFKDKFGTTKVTRYDRYAARRLATKYGSKAVCGILDILAENAEEPYAPVVRSVTQLEDKWVSVLKFVRNIKTDDTIAT